jgi:hypothetical protein
MTREQKDLLLKDLCARLPYGVRVLYENEIFGVEHVCPMYEEVKLDNHETWTIGIDEVKPYLFPLSSMTEEQQEELITITNGKFRYMWGVITNAIPRKNTSEWGVSENAFIDGIEVINILYIWLLKNHFDINGLIPMGLANDATGLDIY